jgi:hypothetical protein
LLGERAFEFAREIARGAAQRLHHGHDFRRRRFELAQPRQRLVGGKDAVAQAGKVARAAASDRQSRQARDMSGAAQRGPDIVARGAVGDKGAIASSRRAIAALSVSGAARRCASSRDPAAVTVQSIASSSDPRRSPTACASVRDWRGWRDRSPSWCRRPRARAATAAGVFRPACGRYR